jgi:hypothetical protein
LNPTAREEKLYQLVNSTKLDTEYVTIKLNHQKLKGEDETNKELGVIPARSPITRQITT